MSKRKKLFVEILTNILALGVSMGGFAVGAFTRDGDYSVWRVASIVLPCALALFMIVNITVGVVRWSKERKRKLRESYDMFTTLKSKIEADFEGAKRAVTRTIVFSYIYMVVCFAIALVAAFAVGRAVTDSEDGVTGALCAIGFIYLAVCGFIGILIAPADINSAPAFNIELDRASYRCLYEIAEKAAAASGCDLPVVLCLVGESIAVSRYRDRVYIALGYLEALELTRDELYAVMLHEFAHVTNKDIKLSKRYGTILEKWDGYGNAYGVSWVSKWMFFSVLYNKMSVDIELYMTFVARDIEAAADNAVRTLGSPDKYASALVKTAFIARFGGTPCRELYYDFYAPEAAHGDFATKQTKMFEAYTQRFGKLWFESIEKELPANVDSHPICRARVEAMGLELSSVDIGTKETDAEYVCETQKLVELADKTIAEQVDYSAVRAENYISRKKAMDDYDAAGKPTSAQVRAALDAFCGIDDDRALEIADYARENYPDCVGMANVVTGVVYKTRFDAKCVEYFRKAAEDPEYTFFAMQSIGEFALAVGDESLIAEYRSSAPEKMQSAMDFLKSDVFSRKSVTEPCDLDSAKLDEVIERIRAASNDKVSKIYMCKYTDSLGKASYPFYVTFKLFSFRKQDAVYETLEKIVEALQDYYETFLLSNTVFWAPRKIKRTPGSLIYDRKKKID